MKKSLKLRIFVSVLSIIVGTILIITVSNYMRSVSILKQKVSESFSNTLGYVGYHLDDYFTQIENIADFIYVNQSIKSALTDSFETSDEYYSKLLGIDESLHYYSINDVFTSIRALKIYGNNDRQITFGEDVSWLDDRLVLDSVIYNEVLDSTGGIIWTGIHEGLYIDGYRGTDVISAYRLIYDKDHKEKIGIMYISITIDMFRELVQNVDLSYNSHIAITDQDNRIVYHENKAYINHKFSEVYTSHEDESGEIHVYEAGSETEMILDIHELRKYGFRIYGLIPVDELVAESRENLMFSIALTVISTVGALLILYLLLSQIFKPVALLVASMKQVHDDMNYVKVSSSGEDEIGILINSYNYMITRINDLVFKDELTGLDNRRAITEKIKRATADSSDNRIVSVVFVDVDNFKEINDTYGHEIGDRVIEITGIRLKELIAEGTEIGRFGGDEFLILIEGTTREEDVINIVKKVNKVFGEPIQVEEKVFQLTVSIGVASTIYMVGEGQDLIKMADMALYKAKALGKNRYAVYDNVMSDEFSGNLQLKNAIAKASSNHEFTLHYQPYVHASDGSIHGFEALIRWHSQDGSNVSPFTLIQNAEESGLIREIGLWIFEEACQFAVRINRNRKEPLTISVNVSAVQLMDSSLPAKFEEILHRYDVAIDYICLEMTETILIKSVERGATVIKKLKAMGFKLSIDDFGTGYSSLSYLKNLPIDILKIDKSFIDTLTLTGFEEALVEIMIEIAHKKGITVTAEGVESEEQYRKLLEFGCDTIQGYYFSKPLDEEKAMLFLEEARRD